MRHAVRMSEFMRTARFGPVQIGMSSDEIEALLGPPEDIMAATDAPDDYRQAPIWTYHDIEFYFDQARRLYQISRSALMVHVEPVPSRALTIDFDFLVEGRRPTARELEAQARELGLEFEYLSAFGERLLVLSSGVYFMFCSDPDDRGASYIGCNPDYLAEIRAGCYPT